MPEPDEPPMDPATLGVKDSVLLYAPSIGPPFPGDAPSVGGPMEDEIKECKLVYNYGTERGPFSSEEAIADIKNFSNDGSIWKLHAVWLPAACCSFPTTSYGGAQHAISELQRDIARRDGRRCLF